MTWPRVKMNELSTLITKGTTPTSIGYSFVDYGIPFVRVQNLIDGRVDVTKEPLFIDNATHSALERSQIQQGDLLVSIAGTIGRAAVVECDLPMNCNQAVAILRLNGKASQRYVLNWLKTSDAHRQMASRGVTGTITNLSLGQIKTMDIPLPPLSEQRRIAAILDEADGLRARRRASLAELDTLLQSTFLEMFGDPVTNPMGWEVVRGTEAFEDLTYGTSRKSINTPTGKALPVLRIPNVIGGQIDWEDLKFVELDGTEATKLQLQLDDILFVRSNGNPDHIGRCARFDGTRPSYYASYLIRGRVKLSIGLTSEFLKHHIEFPSYRHRVRREARTTAGNYNLSTAGIRKFEFIVPPLALQREFAAIVESVEAQKARMRAHLAELDALFASLQSRAFNGEL